MTVNYQWRRPACHRNLHIRNTCTTLVKHKTNIFLFSIINTKKVNGDCGTYKITKDNNSQNEELKCTMMLHTFEQPHPSGDQKCDIKSSNKILNEIINACVRKGEVCIYKDDMISPFYLN